MKKLFSIFSSNLFFFLFFSLIALSVNYAPAVHHFLITPSDRIYSGSVFYSDDYAVYASTIQQGIDGNSGVVNKYTSEPHQPSFIRLNYLLLGKIGGALGFSSIATYHFSRFALGIIFLLLCLYLIQNFVPKNLQRLSFLFLLFSSSWPKFDLNNPSFWLKIQPLYLEPDPIVRFATQPHFQIGAIYSVLAIIFFLSLIKNSKRGDASRGLQSGWQERRVSRRVPAASFSERGHRTGRAPDRTRLGWEWVGPRFALLCAFLIFTAFSFLTDPAQTTVIILTLFLFGLFLLLSKIAPFFLTPTTHPRLTTLSRAKSRDHNSQLTQPPVILKRYFLFFTLTLLSIIPAYLYLRHLFTQEPWSYIFPYFENLRAFPETFHDFFLSFGPVAPFATFGILSFSLSNLPTNDQRPKTNSLLMLIFWLLSSLLLIFILYQPLHINRLRLFHSPLYIPFSIFAAYGILSFDKILSLINHGLSSLMRKKSTTYKKSGASRENVFLSWWQDLRRSYSFTEDRLPNFAKLHFLSADDLGKTKALFRKQNLKLSQNFGRLSYLSLIIILIISLPVLTSSLISQFKDSQTTSALIYPPKTHVEAYDFLKQNTNRSDVVLCLYEACNQIPYFSGNTVFSGNITETLNQPGKAALAQEIFEGKKESLELQRILTEFRIKYLFIGYQEAIWQTDFGKYPFLQKVYQNPTVIIYNVDTIK